jgi:hypothetical protein
MANNTSTTATSLAIAWNSHEHISSRRSADAGVLASPAHQIEGCQCIQRNKTRSSKREGGVVFT